MCYCGNSTGDIVVQCTTRLNSSVIPSELSLVDGTIDIVPVVSIIVSIIVCEL